MPDTTNKIDFLGLPLDADASVQSICSLLKEKGRLQMITFVNPSAWALARRNPEYVSALQRMTYNLADGAGVALACRWLTGLPCTRISFDMTSLADPFFKAAIAEGRSVVLVGGKPGVNEDVYGKIHLNYPELKLVGTHHGYGELSTKVEAVLAQSPDIVIVGMGTPRQEYFLLALAEAGFRGIAITCGGFFDQYLEANPYYPHWIDKWNLRFAYRLYKEPGRLWQRYLLDYPFFLVQAVKAYLEKFRPRRSSVPEQGT